MTELRTLTLGNVDADEPTKKIKRLKPLAEYLQRHLQDSGIDEVRILIARHESEMGNFMREGKVDVYIDSSFPTLQVQKLSGSQVILRRWKKNHELDWGVYVAGKQSGVSRMGDLAGNVLVVEDPDSTSGFVLPLGTLVQQGVTIKEVRGPDAGVGPVEVGYFSTPDELDTIEVLLQGKADIGALTNHDYQELPPEIKDQLVEIGHTIAVPRELVSVQPALEQSLVASLSEVLSGMDEDPEGQRILRDYKETTKFDPLPVESVQALDELRTLIGLVAQD
ncbi:MAG: phosphate/phosphite/phosphonate ABC transporter substrate-binding protein [Dehalococcoidia bacterium]